MGKLGFGHAFVAAPSYRLRTFILCQDRLLLLLDLGLHGLTCLPITDATEDRDTCTQNLQRCQNLCVQDESLKNDNHELVGIHKNQKAGRANQAQHPDASVADTTADDTTCDHPKYSPAVKQIERCGCSRVFVREEY